MRKIINFNPDSLTFIIFKPDSVKQNLEISIWNFLREKGVELLKKKKGFITASKREQSYKDFLINARTNWDLGSELYRLGIRQVFPHL